VRKPNERKTVIAHRDRMHEEPLDFSLDSGVKTRKTNDIIGTL
jgi:hypothetical protein